MEDTKIIYFKKIRAYIIHKNFGRSRHWMYYQFKDYIKKNLLNIRKLQLNVKFYKEEVARGWKLSKENGFSTSSIRSMPSCLILYGYRKLLKDEEIKRKQIKDFIKANEAKFARIESAEKLQKDIDN